MLSGLACTPHLSLSSWQDSEEKSLACTVIGLFLSMLLTWLAIPGQDTFYTVQSHEEKHSLSDVGLKDSMLAAQDRAKGT